MKGIFNLLTLVVAVTSLHVVSTQHTSTASKNYHQNGQHNIRKRLATNGKQKINDLDKNLLKIITDMTYPDDKNSNKNVRYKLIAENEFGTETYSVADGHNSEPVRVMRILTENDASDEDDDDDVVKKVRIVTGGSKRRPSHRFSPHSLPVSLRFSKTLHLPANARFSDQFRISSRQPKSPRQFTEFSAPRKIIKNNIPQIYRVARANNRNPAFISPMQNPAIQGKSFYSDNLKQSPGLNNLLSSQSGKRLKVEGGIVVKVVNSNNQEFRTVKMPLQYTVGSPDIGAHNQHFIRSPSSGLNIQQHHRHYHQMQNPNSRLDHQHKMLMDYL